MGEPAILAEHLVIAIFRDKAGPNADHGFKAHGVQLPVHGDRIRPVLWIHVDLAHFGVVEPVHHHHIGGQMAVAVTLRGGQEFCLIQVPLLALDVSVGRLGKQVRWAREQFVSGINLVRGLPGNDEKGDPVAHLRSPARALVEARLNERLGRVVPNQAVSLVGDGKGTQVLGAAVAR